MSKHEVIGAAQDLIRAGGSFVLATVDQDGIPQVRWMGAALLEEPLTVYMVAGAESRKMGQMKAHPKSQLMFQSADYARVATLSGTCEIVGDAKTKQRVWDGIPGAANFFKGPDDPGFGAIRFVCTRVEVLGLKEGMATAAAEL
jgi:general stress protein 26